MQFLKIVSLLFLSFFFHQSVAESQVKVNNDMARQWNQFVTDLISLNDRLIKNKAHDESWRIGGYSNEPHFFDEVTYTDKNSGHVTSILQWERRDPSAIHSIEVKLRDKNGRVYKDFSASYLTKHRNAPIQTLIILHYYNKKLHGFRVFDASSNRIFEVCRGSLNGKTVNIDLDDDYGELSEALADKKGIMSSKAYKACFGGRKVDTNRLKIPSD